MSIKVNWRKRPELSGKRERQSTGGKSVGKSESRWMTMDTHTHTHTNAHGAKLQSTAWFCSPSSSPPLSCVFRFCYLPSCILAPWHMKPPWGGSERTKVQKPLGNFINNKLSDALMTWKYTYMTRQASHVQTASYKEEPQLWGCLALLCLPTFLSACLVHSKCAALIVCQKVSLAKIHFSSFFLISLSLLFYSFFFNLWNLLCSCIWHEAFGATKPFDRPRRSKTRPVPCVPYAAPNQAICCRAKTLCVLSQYINCPEVSRHWCSKM